MSICDNTICVICIDALLESEHTITIDCGHQFHTNCLNKWSEKNDAVGSFCPVCRHKYIVTNPENTLETDREIESDECVIDLRVICVKGTICLVMIFFINLFVLLVEMSIF